MALVKYAQFQQCDAGDSFIAEAGGNDEYRLGSADDERVLDTGAEADIVGSEYGDRGEYPVRDNDILRKSQAEMLGFLAVWKCIVLQTRKKQHKTLFQKTSLTRGRGNTFRCIPFPPRGSPIPFPPTAHTPRRLSTTSLDTVVYQVTHLPQYADDVCEL